jgi:hypothetical protein
MVIKISLDHFLYIYPSKDLNALVDFVLLSHESTKTEEYFLEQFQLDLAGFIHFFL